MILNIINFDKILTLRTSQAGIPILRKLPYGVRSRYKDGTEVNARRQKSVYRRHGMSTAGARSRFTDFVFYCVLAPECPSHRDTNKIVAENNFFHETQRIFMNKFCMWTPSGQRTS